MTLLEKWATAIKQHEGWFVGSRSYRNNNPGNLRYSKYQAGVRDGFSFFRTYEDGWKGLLFQLQIAADGRSKVFKPTMTLYDFFDKYAPSSDGNAPAAYAEAVAKEIGLSPTTQIKSLLA